MIFAGVGAGHRFLKILVFEAQIEHSTHSSIQPLAYEHEHFSIISCLPVGLFFVLQFVHDAIKRVFSLD